MKASKQEMLTDVINELENDDLTPEREEELTELYHKLTTPPPKKWNREELTAAVKAYDEMHRKDKAGESFSKAAYYKQLAAEHDRSAKSFEYRMQNISYVYQLNGLGFVTGLKPAANVGRNVIAELQSIIKEVRQ